MGKRSAPDSDSLKAPSKRTQAVSWSQLGLCAELLAAVEPRWPQPSEIQRKSIPIGLAGDDLIGIAETGSGKTAAFVLPTLQRLLEKHSRDKNHEKKKNKKQFGPKDKRELFCLCLAPTRELVVQIAEQFKSLGEGIGANICTLIGGADSTNKHAYQQKQLKKAPHVIVASPGILIHHLENTDFFRSQLESVETLIFDEADRLLQTDFEPQIHKIVKTAGKRRRPQTYLFSATMTDQVSSLETAAMLNAVRVKVDNIYETPKNLQQSMWFMPSAEKTYALVALLRKRSSASVIVFCNTTKKVIEVQAILEEMEVSCTSVYGQMHQKDRFKNLDRFVDEKANVLVTTDVGSRGLDIPSVEIVVNYDVPEEVNHYIHRVGRTARAGASGEAITMVTLPEHAVFHKLEEALFPEKGADDGLNPFDGVSPAEVDSVRKDGKAAEREAGDKAKQRYSGLMIKRRNKRKKNF